MLSKLLLFTLTSIFLFTGATSMDSEGESFTIRYEGMRLKTYKCQAGKRTIGAGHTGADVYDGMIITWDQGLKIFRKDVTKFERLVLKEIPRPMPQNQFNVAVDIGFNAGNVFKNTVLGFMMRTNHPLASKQIMKFVKFKNPKTGKYEISKGLLRRATARAKVWDGIKEEAG